jgi:hypothetical protein
MAVCGRLMWALPADGHSTLVIIAEVLVSKQKDSLSYSRKSKLVAWEAFNLTSPGHDVVFLALDEVKVKTRRKKNKSDTVWVLKSRKNIW